MSIILVSYLLVIIAFIVLMKNYQSRNWIWLGLLIVSIFFGIAPYVAAAYIVAAVVDRNNKLNHVTPKVDSNILYHPDGSYTLYKAEDSKQAVSPGMVAFRVVGGLIAGTAIAFGLFVVGIILLFTLAPSIACGGSSKCY